MSAPTVYVRKVSERVSVVVRVEEPGLPGFLDLPNSGDRLGLSDLVELVDRHVRIVAVHAAASATSA